MADVLRGYWHVTAWCAALLCALGCARSEQVAAAKRDRARPNAIAHASYRTSEALLAAYDRAGIEAIKTAATAAEAHAAVAEVRARWRPVWDAYAALREAHDALADDLERGGPADPTAVVRAWCALLRAAEAVSAEVPHELEVCP